MFSAYVDESGRDDAGIFVMAGYVFDPRSGTKFENSWSKVLERWKISELHMKDLTRFSGEFTGWSEKKRSVFLSSLIDIIHRRAKFHVAVAVDTYALQSLEPSDKKVILDIKKYSVALAHFLAEVSHWLGPTEPIVFLYDCVPQNFDKDRVELEFIDQRRKGSFHPRSSTQWYDSKDWEGIQAADFLAYEIGREFTRVLGRADYPPRISGDRLIRGIGENRRHEVFIDKDWIDGFIASARSDPEGVATIEMLARRNRHQRR